MNAVSKPGTVLRKEFVNGMMNVFGKDSIEGLKSIVPSLDPGFLERSDFRDFYKFVFQFSREGTHKTIEKDMILALMTMVLDKNRAPHLDHFVEFLKGCSHQRITLDQWDSFLQFQHSIKVDLSNYDEDGACKCWPILHLFLHCTVYSVT
jgi:Cullin binding